MACLDINEKTHINSLAYSHLACFYCNPKNGHASISFPPQPAMTAINKKGAG